MKRHTNAQDDLLELVDILQQIDETAPCSKMNQYSMRNCYYEGLSGNDSELRTWFYHYKTLKKNGIIRSNETMEG